MGIHNYVRGHGWSSLVLERILRLQAKLKQRQLPKLTNWSKTVGVIGWAILSLTIGRLAWNQSATHLLEAFQRDRRPPLRTWTKVLGTYSLNRVTDSSKVRRLLRQIPARNSDRQPIWLCRSSGIVALPTDASGADWAVFAPNLTAITPSDWQLAGHGWDGLDTIVRTLEQERAHVTTTKPKPENLDPRRILY